MLDLIKTLALLVIMIALLVSVQVLDKEELQTHGLKHMIIKLWKGSHGDDSAAQ